ncbi:TRAP transporter substrate-binding protein DctP [Pikeienuella sp. HZG-20]|uniref:TRAP transporter substrate-binding protein DctP n=1 Tax=Paludibacillus litoralis TaxID=3133267 RepID=UPI0030ECD6A6
MNRTTRICGWTAAATALTAALTGGQAVAEPVEAQIGMIFSPAAPMVRCGADFVAADAALKEAGLNFTVVHSSQLGSEVEMVQQVSSGELEATIGTASILGSYVDGLSVLETYYLYDTVDDVIKVHATDVAGKLFDELLEVANIRRIGEPWLYGERHIFGKKALREPADFEGLRLRVPQTSVSIAGAQSLGASPTPTTYGELYLSLQQGIVDAAEAPAAVANAESFHEPSDYFNKTGHLITAVPMIVNEDFWRSLTPEQRTALNEAATAAAASVRKCVEEADEEAYAEWRESGAVEIVDDVNREALKANARAFFSDGFDWSPVYVDLIAELEN